MTRGGANMVARVAHNHEVAGSNPAPAKAYNRAGQLLIRPLLLSGEYSAFDLARLFYQQYSNLNFWDDLISYHESGYVVSRPGLFGMAKPHRLANGDDAWHLQICVGNMLELISCLPCKLPWVTFARNNDGNVRIVRWDRFERLARRIAAKMNQNGEVK